MSWDSSSLDERTKAHHLLFNIIHIVLNHQSGFCRRCLRIDRFKPENSLEYLARRPLSGRVSPTFGSILASRKTSKIRPLLPMRFPQSRVPMLHVAAALALASLVGAARGGVTSEAEAGLSASPTAAPAGIPQDKTVELLLQLQDQRARTSESGRREPIGTKATPAMPAADVTSGGPSPGVAGGPSLRDALLTEGARFAAENAQENPAKSPRSDAGNPPGLPVMATPDASRPAVRDAEPPSFLSNPVVRFVRENRALALGAAVAVLVALWLTANFSSRSRRR